ncbi:MAG: efflux RND transporter permease subunit, partial [Candidatus Eremiobacteraeota bacterium]|nr:efflux RND transporter permease subunit [Candidatus Eremiobacteraeota bacterium]
VQQAVDQARQFLPADLDPPEVSKNNTAGDPILLEAISSYSLKPNELSNIITNEIIPDLRNVKGVGGGKIDVSADVELHRDIDDAVLNRGPDVLNMVDVLQLIFDGLCDQTLHLVGAGARVIRVDVHERKRHVGVDILPHRPVADEPE